MRAFLAIDFPDSIKRVYAEVLDDLRESFASMRWVSPPCLHVTLRFLGDFREDDAEALRAPVTELTRTQKPFRLGLGRAGSYGPRSAPRTLWIGVAEGGQPLGRLQAGLEDVVCRLGHEPETRAWNAHITLARRPQHGAGGKGKSALTAALWQAAAAALGLGELWFEVRELVLFSSLLSPEGPTYTPVWTSPLAVTTEHEVTRDT